MNIRLNSKFFTNTFRFSLTTLTFNCIVTSSSIDLWEKINRSILALKENKTIEDVAKNENIRAARNVYKFCGKDPLRYRLSADSLLRRIAKGNNLYKVNNVVDILNYISIKTGISIGAYNLDKIESPVILDIGTTTDIYEGIGRGVLNINGMPVLRDKEGPFGSPTSDSVRTLISPQTNRAAFVFYDFANFNEMEAYLNETKTLLKEFCSASNFELRIVK